MAKTLKYREVERALVTHDARFRFERAKGSDIKLSHPDFPETVCLPHHGDGDSIHAGVLSRIVRTFSLPRAFFAPASPKAKPSTKAIVTRAFDVLRSISQPLDNWLPREIHGALYCFLRRRLEPKGNRLRGELQVMTVRYRDDQLTLHRSGREFTFKPHVLRSLTPERLASAIWSFSRSPLPRPRAHHDLRRTSDSGCS